MSQTTLPAAPGAVSLGPLRGWRNLAAYTALLAIMSVALYMIFIFAPPERVQGDVQRLLYGHVSVAWLAFVAFGVVVIGSAMYLWRRTAGWDHLAVASAEIGVVFTTLTLASGAIWARIVWGVWWAWEPRLTSTLVLWFVYVGYLAARAYIDSDSLRRRVAAVIGIFGFVDVPIVWFSVQWWRSLHPLPTITQSDGGFPREMLITLLVAVLAFTVFYAVLLRQRFLLERAADESVRLRELIRDRKERPV